MGTGGADVMQDVILNGGMEWPKAEAGGKGGGSGRNSGAPGMLQQQQQTLYDIHSRRRKLFYVFLVSFTNFMVPFSGALRFVVKGFVHVFSAAARSSPGRADRLICR